MLQWTNNTSVILLHQYVFSLLPALGCARANGDSGSTCLEFNVLSPAQYFVLYLASDRKRIKNIP